MWPNSLIYKAFKLMSGLIGSLVLCVACVLNPDLRIPVGAQSPWLGVDVQEFDDADFVVFKVRMLGQPAPEALRDYGRCAAAEYGRDHGLGFARHLRTVLAPGGLVGRADIAFTFSAQVPDGVRVIELRPALRDCHTRGIISQ